MTAPKSFESRSLSSYAERSLPLPHSATPTNVSQALIVEPAESSPAAAAAAYAANTSPYYCDGRR